MREQFGLSVNTPALMSSALPGIFEENLDDILTALDNIVTELFSDSPDFAEIIGDSLLLFDVSEFLFLLS